MFSLFYKRFLSVAKTKSYPNESLKYQDTHLDGDLFVCQTSTSHLQSVIDKQNTKRAMKFVA